MTGRYAFRTGMWDSDYESELPLEETTLAEELQSLGYKTYMVSTYTYMYFCRVLAIGISPAVSLHISVFNNYPSLPNFILSHISSSHMSSSMASGG